MFILVLDVYFLHLGRFIAPVADSYFVQLCWALFKASYSDSTSPSLGNYNRLGHPHPHLSWIECRPSLCDMWDPDPCLNRTRGAGDSSILVAPLGLLGNSPTKGVYLPWIFKIIRFFRLNPVYGIFCGATKIGLAWKRARLLPGYKVCLWNPCSRAHLHSQSVC